MRLLDNFIPAWSRLDQWGVFEVYQRCPAFDGAKGLCTLKIRYLSAFAEPFSNLRELEPKHILWITICQCSYAMLTFSFADPDPGSCAFRLLDCDTGSGIWLLTPKSYIYFQLKCNLTKNLNYILVFSNKGKPNICSPFYLGSKNTKILFLDPQHF